MNKHLDALKVTELSESFNQNLSKNGDELPDRPDSLPNWKMSQNERLLKSPKVEWADKVLSPLCIPPEQQAMLGEMTPGSNDSEDVEVSSLFIKHF